MQAFRQIVDSDQLDKIALPENFQDRKLEIKISLIEDEAKDDAALVARKKAIWDCVGILEKYKNPDLIPLEKEAWGMAVMEKHSLNRCECDFKDNPK